MAWVGFTIPAVQISLLAYVRFGARKILVDHEKTTRNFKKRIATTKISSSEISTEETDTDSRMSSTLKSNTRSDRPNRLKGVVMRHMEILGRLGDMEIKSNLNINKRR